MKRIAIILMCLICLTLGACIPMSANAEQTRPLKIWYHNSNGAMHTYCLRDDDTGVNYVVVSTERGNGEYSIAITPRLNADGSLYVTN